MRLISRSTATRATSRAAPTGGNGIACCVSFSGVLNEANFSAPMTTVRTELARDDRNIDNRSSNWDVVEISEKHEGKIAVLTPAGRIDNETSPSFQARLLDAVGTGAVPVLLDFSGVEYISSAGLRALLMASKK